MGFSELCNGPVSLKLYKIQKHVLKSKIVMSHFLPYTGHDLAQSEARWAGEKSLLTWKSQVPGLPSQRLIHRNREAASTGLRRRSPPTSWAPESRIVKPGHKSVDSKSKDTKTCYSKVTCILNMYYDMKYNTYYLLHA